MTEPASQIADLLLDPSGFWPNDDYFHRRNREKIARAVASIRREVPHSDEADIATRLLELVHQRRRQGIGPLMVMSNGASGCHHLGILLNAVPGYSFTDEVYFPPSLLKGPAGDESHDGLAVEALDLLHMGTVGKRALTNRTVNIGHLRADAHPHRLRERMPNAAFVLLLRNPYQVAMSRGLRKPEYRSASGFADVDDLDYLERQAAITGTHFHRAAAAQWDAIVRYEALVRDPVGTLYDLLRQLGHPVRAADIAAALHGEASRPVTDASNHNPTPWRDAEPDEAAVLARNLATAAQEWGYDPPTSIVDAVDTLAVAESEPRFWWPLFADIHRNQAAYDRLEAGRVKVFRNLPETDLPDDHGDWTADPLGDRSWRLFYHSLGWLLARSWAINRGIDEQANLIEIEQTVFSHIAATVEKPAQDPMAWDDHATGDRLAVLAILYHHHLRDRVSATERRRILHAIEVHVARISEFHQDGQWLDSNHGAFHALGAINAGLALGAHPIGRWAQQIGSTYLAEVIGSIVDSEEGVAVEQSIAYHTIDLTLLRQVVPVLLENDLQLDVDVDVAETCSRMVEFNYVTRGADDSRPSIGDTPYGDAHPSAGLSLAEGEPETEHLRHIRTAGEAGTPFPSLLVYPRTGLAVMRKGEPELDTEVVSRVVVSFHGERIHHGHQDQLSVTFQVDDHAVLVDPGGPFSYGDPLRFGYFVASRAHNTVLVDETDHTGSGRILAHGSRDGVDWVIVEHDGYSDVQLRRAVILVDGDLLVVLDHGAPSAHRQRHDYRTLWHFATTAEATIANPDRRSGRLLVDLPHPTRPMKLGMRTAKCTPRLLRGVPADQEFGPQGWVTRELGDLTPCPVLQVDTTSATHRAATWIGPADREVASPGPGSITARRRSGEKIDISFDSKTVRLRS